MSDEGWICPKCGAVMAPFMVECVNNKRHDKAATTADAVSPQYDPRTSRIVGGPR